ncbi:YbaB/EbfC family nucleoid-associated protein [Nocardia tenerifensis]|uniref:YbaB/EbfC family nucleoid-associated protein n=1 Tax=Nocardia tenerifensis TaxID=228006 RepID=UPI0002DE9CD5|nr:YbaB/EbfC family nucleoid-associated protein [Nocardia tenerifensis]
MVHDPNERLRTEVAQVVADVHRLIAGFAEAKRQHQAVTASASAERGLIVVVADVSGALTEVYFEDDIEQLGYHQIARGVVQAAQRAAAQVKSKADEIISAQRGSLLGLPKLSDLVDWVPDEQELPSPPAALLTPPAEREPVADTAEQAGLLELQEQRARLFATASAGGRRVSVAVNADGVLIDLQFSGAVGDLDYEQIAEAIVAASGAAVAAVARKVADLYAPTVEDDRPSFPGSDVVLAGLDRLRDQLR